MTAVNFADAVSRSPATWAFTPALSSDAAVTAGAVVVVALLFLSLLLQAVMVPSASRATMAVPTTCRAPLFVLSIRGCLFFAWIVVGFSFSRPSPTGVEAVAAAGAIREARE